MSRILAYFTRFSLAHFRAVRKLFIFLCHLRGCVLQVRVIEDVVSRFHASSLAPRDFHPHTLVDPGEAHVAYRRSAEVVKEK